MNDRTGPEIVSSAQSDYDAMRFVSPERPCPYLPDRAARSEAYWVDQLDGATYERMLARGFRRSGNIVYRPRCRACKECRQLRVPVARFAPTRSMRRIMRRNQDVVVTQGRPTADGPRFEVYRRYLDAQHDGSMARTFETFREFLYDSPTETVEFRYHLGDRLIGVSISDRVPDGLSSVYMFFEPEFSARSLGTFSILWEIEHCRKNEWAYYYLGFLVAGAKTMAYKARFRPFELLIGDDRWVTVQADDEPRFP